MTNTSLTPNIQVSELLSKAWTLFLANVVLLVVSGVILTIVGSAIVFFGAHTCGVGYLALPLLKGTFAFGFALICLKIVRNQSTDFPDILAGFQQIGPTYLVGLILIVLGAIGFALCVLPALFVAFIYMFTLFFMVDEKLDAWSAMEKSRMLVMRDMGAWIGLFLVVVAINIAGLFACTIGLLVTAPLSMLMLALAYDQVAGAAALRDDSSDANEDGNAY